MMTFLPEYPFSANAVLLFGLLLIAGVIGGELVKRALALPRILGYVLVGLALGASGLDLLDTRLAREAWIFVDIALGLILFELGRRLDFAWLRRDPWLAASGVLESALAFGSIFLALLFFDVRPLYAALAAAVGMATSPAVVMVIAQELRAEGQVTERMLNLTAINSILAFVTSAMLLAWVHSEYRAGWLVIVLHPLYLLAGSALLGYVAALAALLLARWLRGNGRTHLVAVLALIVVTVGAARMLDLSVVLSMLAFGVLSKNLDRRHDLMTVELGWMGQVFVVVLFVVSGASLRSGEFLAGGTLALVYVFARFAGKSLGVMSLTYLSGVRRGTAGLLCLALTPMSATTVGMMQRTAQLYPDLGAALSAIVLSAVLILELVGPVAAQFALKRAGEAAAESVP